MAAAECTCRRRFVVACGVLSQCVRDEAVAAARKAAAATTPCSPHPTAETAAWATMLLMPGANVAPDVVVREEEAEATPATKAQLTIMYGGRVLVFDDVPSDKAATLVRVAVARQDMPGGGRMVTDVPVERKASLQRFMEKRRERRDARAPYAASARPTVAASKKGQEEGDAGCWLELGITGGSAR